MLINCVAYQEGKKLRDIEISEIGAHLRQSDCFVWVALRDPEPAELERMQMEFRLHELAVEDAHHGHQRPKIDEYDDSLFAAIPILELADGEIRKGEMDVFVGPNYVLSVRNNSEHGFRNVRARCESEPQLLRLGPAFVLYALMDAVVDRYFPVAEALESELETIEDQMLTAGSKRGSIQRLYQLKRKTTLLKHAVMPLMEATGRLLGGRVPAPFIHTRNYFRDVYDHLHRINTTIDTIRETIATAIQVNLSMVATDQAEVNKRLAAWAAIFAVATVFAGIWGMNFAVMPELHWKYGYYLALGIIAAVCGYLYYRFQRAGWL